MTLAYRPKHGLSSQGAHTFWTKKIPGYPDEEPSVYHGAILPEKAISGRKSVRLWPQKGKKFFSVQKKSKNSAQKVLSGNGSRRAAAVGFS
jgi:hypothetical protein